MTKATDAYGFIAQQLNDTVNAGAMAIVGYIPEIRWPDRSYGGAPDSSKIWLRFSTSAQGVVKQTLSMPARITMQGLLNVQIFCPTSQINSAQVGRSLAELIEAAYANCEINDIMYTKAYTKELPREAALFSFRVTATYRYDDFH